MQKENRRTKMTKSLLNEALLNVLSKKPLSRITVKEICGGADVNRSTYYTYYTDPYDQLRKLEAELMKDLSDFIEGILGENRTDIGQLFLALKGVLEYVHSKQCMFRVLLECGDFHLQKDILEFFAEKVVQPHKLTDIEDSELLQRYIFVSNGSFGMLYYWLISGCREDVDPLARKIGSFIRMLDGI